MKLLSILIPAFHYPEGVRNILNALSNAPISQVEIIIGDDSVDDSVLRVAREFDEKHPGLISYVKNSPSLGAVRNWNALLNKATGKYVVLMHHDEFPISKDWLFRLLVKLGPPNCSDIIVMPCVLFSGVKFRIRGHLPKFVQDLTLKFFPSYLFRRNVVGPTSCLVIRRDFYPQFDENLRWLVDVDMYWRLLDSTKNFSIDPELQIGSISNRKDSITKTMAGEVGDIRKVELAYLNQKYPNTTAWLPPDRYRTLFFCETILWGVFKCAYLPYSRVLGIFKS